MVSRILINLSCIWSLNKDRWKILFLYLWLTLKYLFITRVVKRELRSSSFLGYRMVFPSYWRFYYLFECIFIQREYEFTAERVNPRIIDGGSNIGLSVIFFKYLYPEAKLYAFEPEPETFAILKENVESNGLKDVKIYNLALYDRKGELEFFKDECGSLTMSVFSEREGGEKIIVNCDCLSNYIDEPVDLLKLDLEGSEDRVIKELAEKGKLSLVRCLVMEYHHNIKGRTPSLLMLLELLEKNGFSYQIRSPLFSSRERTGYQDLMIYAYNQKFQQVL